MPAAGQTSGTASTGSGWEPPVRIGRWEVRSLGGARGCLVMILLSIVSSVVLTVLLNLILR
jgi:hypothetical protein